MTSRSKCPFGHYLGSRERVGPTGSRFDWSILVNYCYRCGYQVAVYPERLTYHQKNWLERWDKRAIQSYEKSVLGDKIAKFDF